MRKKVSKKDYIISNYLDKLENEWRSLTYDEIRKLIYRDSQYEVTVADLNGVCRSYGLYRDANKSNLARKSFWGKHIITCRR